MSICQNGIGISINIFNEPPGTCLTDSQWEQVACKLKLSQRETEVCQLLFLGMTRDEIAESLQIKSRTVRQFMEQIHIKLKVKNRVEVVLRVIQARDYLGKDLDLGNGFDGEGK